MLHQPLEAGDARRSVAERGPALPRDVNNQQALKTSPHRCIHQCNVLDEINPKPLGLPEGTIVRCCDVVALVTTKVDVARDGEAVELDHDGDTVTQDKVDHDHQTCRLPECLRHMITALYATLVDVVEVETELPFAVGHLLPRVRVGVDVHLDESVMKLVHVDAEGRWPDVIQPTSLLKDVEEQIRQALRALQHLLAKRLHHAKQQCLCEQLVSWPSLILLDLVSNLPQSLEIQLAASGSSKRRSRDVQAPSRETLKGSAVNNLHGLGEVGLLRAYLAVLPLLAGILTLLLVLRPSFVVDHLGGMAPASPQRADRADLCLDLLLQDRRLRCGMLAEPPSNLLSAREGCGLELKQVVAAQRGLLGKDGDVAHLWGLHLSRLVRVATGEFLLLGPRLVPETPLQHEPRHLSQAHACQQHEREQDPSS
mmetsp:Transcript_134520/g.348469  ORF Transcript_134520/g.348469 Transcript_134520/m.348469 type:complete len:425 (-) Transcript_134520:1649-2923(-)